MGDVKRLLMAATLLRTLDLFVSSRRATLLLRKHSFAGMHLIPKYDESRTESQQLSASRLQAQFIAWETRAAHAH